jgi:hypothetical protein
VHIQYLYIPVQLVSKLYLLFYGLLLEPGYVQRTGKMEYLLDLSADSEGDLFVLQVVRYQGKSLVELPFLEVCGFY